MDGNFQHLMPSSQDLDKFVTELYKAADIKAIASVHNSNPAKGRIDNPAVMPKRLNRNDPQIGHASPKEPTSAPNSVWLGLRAALLALQLKTLIPKFKPNKSKTEGTKITTADWYPGSAEVLAKNWRMVSDWRSSQ